MVAGVVALVIGAVVVAIGVAASIRGHRADRRYIDPIQRARLDYLNARERVDAVFLAAKQCMEVRTGTRQPGERRIGDTLGSWGDLL